MMPRVKCVKSTHVWASSEPEPLTWNTCDAQTVLNGLDPGVFDQMTFQGVLLWSLLAFWELRELTTYISFTCSVFCVSLEPVYIYVGRNRTWFFSVMYLDSSDVRFDGWEFRIISGPLNCFDGRVPPHVCWGRHWWHSYNDFSELFFRLGGERAIEMLYFSWGQNMKYAFS